MFIYYICHLRQLTIFKAVLECCHEDANSKKTVVPNVINAFNELLSCNVVDFLKKLQFQIVITLNAAQRQ